MIMFYDTSPVRLKMPDERKIISHKHRITKRLTFHKNKPDTFEPYIGDLTEYYDFTNENGITMEHDIIRTGIENSISSDNVLVCFYFMDDIDAMAFKLRWH